MNAVTREEWMHALLVVQRGRMCWCDFGSGNPMMYGHSKACTHVRELFAESKPAQEQKHYAFKQLLPEPAHEGQGKGGGAREVVPSSGAPVVESTTLTRP